MDQEQLNDIFELDNLATPGPWYAHFTDDQLAANAIYVSTEPENEQIDPGRALAEGFPEQVDPGFVVAIVLLQNPELARIRDERWDVNARFIAAARTYVPEMAREIVRLRSELAILRKDNPEYQGS
jgi:hypothetical protein